MTLALLLFGLGAAGALLVYGRSRPADALAERLARALRPLHTACSELWGIDRLWHRLFARGVGDGLAPLAARADLGTPARLGTADPTAVDGAAAPFAATASLDGFVDGLGRACARLGRAGARAHAGRVSAYLAFASALAAAAALWSLLR